MAYRFAAVALLVACVSSFSNSAFAENVDDATRSAARNLGTAGVQAYQAEDFKTANDKLERAYRVLRVPSLGLWSARSLAKLGRLIEAGERYLEVTRLTISSGDETVQKRAQQDAQSELDALGPRIPSIVVQIEGAPAASVAVEVDGVALDSALLGEARPVNPGPHRVLGKLGGERVPAELTIAEGEKKPVVLRFHAAPVDAAANSGSTGEPLRAHASSPWRTVGLVAGAAGVVALGVGTVFGLSAKSNNDKSNADGHCNARGCDATGTELRNDALGAARLSTALFIGGGVLVAGGATLYLIGGHSSSESSLAASPLLANGAAGLAFHGGF